MNTERISVPAAKIVQVLPNMPAIRAGLREGDIIWKVNSTQIVNANEYSAAVRGLCGQTITLLVFRVEGERTTQFMASLPTQSVHPCIGAYMSDATMNYPILKVTNVDTESPAAKAGISPGDVMALINNKLVFGNSNFFFEEIQRHATSTTAPMVLRIRRDNREFNIEITPELRAALPASSPPASSPAPLTTRSEPLADPPAANSEAKPGPQNGSPKKAPPPLVVDSALSSQPKQQQPEIDVHSSPSSVEEAIQTIQKVLHEGGGQLELTGTWDAQTEQAVDKNVSELQKNDLWSAGWHGNTNGSDWQSFSGHLRDRANQLEKQIAQLRDLTKAIDYLKTNGVYHELPSCGLRHTGEINAEAFKLALLNGFFREWGDELFCRDLQCRERAKLLMTHFLNNHKWTILPPNIVGAFLCPFTLVAIALIMFGRHSSPQEAFLIGCIADVAESVIGAAGEWATFGTMISGFLPWLLTTIVMAILTGGAAAWARGAVKR